MIRSCYWYIDVHQTPFVEALQHVRIHQVHLEPWGPHRCLARPQLAWRQVLGLALGCVQMPAISAVLVIEQRAETMARNHDISRNNVLVAGSLRFGLRCAHPC